jgi:GxxExxY protein
METRSNRATEKSLEDAGITDVILACAIEVHKTLGPGLLESVYEACLALELEKSGCLVERQKSLPVKYKDHQLHEGFRLDLLVNDSVIVELKCVERVMPIHEAQLYTYLKLSGKKTGLILNFFTKLMKDGIHRIVC